MGKVSCCGVCATWRPIFSSPSHATLHCNLTAAMVENCTALIGYKTYPHVDMYEVAEQIGRVVLDAVDGRVDPVVSWGRSDLLSQTLCQGTDDEPMRSLVAMCREAEARPGVLAATTFGGFALADMPDAGNSAVVVTDGDRRLADEIRDGLLDRTWAEREAFVYRHRPIEEALDKARAFEGGPVMLLDHADNCGSGATQDVMTAIEAGDARGARGRDRGRGLGSGSGGEDG